MTKTPTKRKRGRPLGSRNKPRQASPVERLGYRVEEYTKAFNVSRSALYAAIRRGEIRTKKIGKCRIILPD
jgi:hypothetical protein